MSDSSLSPASAASDGSTAPARPTIVFAPMVRAARVIDLARVFFPLVIGLEADAIFWSDESDLGDFCPVIPGPGEPATVGAERLTAYQARITAAWGVVPTSTRIIEILEQLAPLPHALTPVPLGVVPWADDWVWEDAEGEAPEGDHEGDDAAEAP